MFAAIGRRVTRRPWLVIITWLLASIGIIIVAPGIGSVTTSDQASFLPGSAESVRAADLARQAFPQAGGATGVLVITPAAGGQLDGADLRTVAALAGTLNAERPPAVLGIAFDQATGVAANRTVAIMPVQFRGNPQDKAVGDAVTRLRTRADQALAGTGLRAGLTGTAAITLDDRNATAHAEKIVTITTVILIVLLLLLIFRSPVAALLPLATVGLVFGLSSSLVAIAAHALNFRIGAQVPLMLTVVLFGIGTDYLLFLLFRYRERLRAGDGPREAIVAAVARVGRAVFSAAAAVIVAFGALLLARLGFFTTLGPSLAIGVAIMLVAALTLLPAVVTVLGRRVFWPSRDGARTGERSVFGAIGRVVARCPAIVLAGAVTLLASLAAAATAFKPSYDPVTQLPAGAPATRSYLDLTRGFPAGALAPTDIYLHRGTPFTAAEIGAYLHAMAAAPGVAMPGAPVVAADGRTVDVPVVLRVSPFTSAALTLVAGPLRQAARANAPPGSQILLGGQTMASADLRRTTDGDFRLIFPVAVALFLLILAGTLLSALAPVYLVVMVAAGFVATLGGATLVFQVAAGHAGLHFAMPIVLYLFVTAIGTDYNILMTARLREETAAGAAPRDAAARAITHAGPSIAAAALILAGTFASLLISGVPFFVEIGFGTTLGILLVAFVISLLLVPAVTALIGRVAWWPAGAVPRRGVPRVSAAAPASTPVPAPASTPVPAPVPAPDRPPAAAGAPVAVGGGQPAAMVVERPSRRRLWRIRRQTPVRKEMSSP